MLMALYSDLVYTIPIIRIQNMNPIIFIIFMSRTQRGIGPVAVDAYLGII